MAYGDNVQTPQSTNGNGTSINVAYATTPTAGNTLIACGASFSGAQSLTGSGNTWTNKATQTAADLSHTQAYVLSCAGAAETVTFAQAGFASMCIAELAGTNDAEITTQVGANLGTAIDTASYTVTSGDLANGNILAIGSTGENLAGTFTPDAPWTELKEGGGFLPAQLSKHIITATGSIAFGGDWTAGNNSLARMTILKPPAAAGGRRSRLAFLGAG